MRWGRSRASSGTPRTSTSSPANAIATAILRVFEAAGYRTEVTFPHWLAKAWVVERFVDVIYRSGNGVAAVDDEWFEHAVDAELLGIPVRLCPPEEIIWSKAYVQERERFDGADIAHLIRKSGRAFDWRRLIRRFGDHWRVLLGHLVNFGFVYPGRAGHRPRLGHSRACRPPDREAEEPPPPDKVCQGTLLSREQYLVDIALWGYEDARLEPRGRDDRRGDYPLDGRHRPQMMFLRRPRLRASRAYPSRPEHRYVMKAHTRWSIPK